MVKPHQPVGPPTVTARVAAIVSTLAARPRLSVAELAHVVRLPRSTTHRLLSALDTGDVVERTACGGYELRLEGPRQGGAQHMLRADITAMVRDLAEVTGSQVRFGVWHQRGVSALKQPGVGGGGADLPRNELLPIHATALGKALLAFAPEREVKRVLSRPLLPYTSRTLTTPEVLRSALATTRLCGMAVAVCEFGVDECGLAVPVFGPDGVIGSLEISGTDSLSDIKSSAPALRYAARALGRGLALHPAWLPTGAGWTPLRWPLDPIPLAADDETQVNTPGTVAGVGGNRVHPDSAYPSSSTSIVPTPPRRVAAEE